MPCSLSPRRPPSTRPSTLRELRAAPGRWQATVALTCTSVWISLSSSVIVFNKWILDTAGFREYPASAVTNLTRPLTVVLQGSVRVPNPLALARVF